MKRVIESSPRELYVDLLVRTLTGMIYRDSSINPINIGPFQNELRLEGHDWPSVAHTMVGVKRLENLRTLTQRVLDEQICGNLIETGVWRGGCCILMRGVLAANGVTDRNIYVADSFAGVPAPRADLFPQDNGFDLSHFRELAVPLNEVRSNFEDYGLLDDQVIFVPGLFQETLPSLNAGPFALMRLDGDLYESTYTALNALYPRLSPGGFVIIDDYGVLPPSKAAVLDYRAQMGITAVMHEIDWSGIWWQKRAEES